MSPRVNHLVQKSAVRALMAALAGVLLPALALAAPGAISGTVVDAANHAVAGATLTVAARTASTDANGHYLFASISAGTVTVRAVKDATMGWTQVKVTSGTTVTAPTITLSSNWGAISGKVTNAATSLPLGGAYIAIGGTNVTAVTGANGIFRFGKVPAGAQTLVAVANGYQTTSTSVAVPSDHSTVTANIALTTVGTTPPPPPPPPSGGPGSTILWNGTSTYLFGVDYAWYNYGTDFGIGAWSKFTDWNAVGTGFASLKTAGTRIVRYWVFGDGRYAPEFNADGTVSGLDSYVLADVDRLLQIAADNNVYLLLTVIDGSMWSKPVSASGVTMGGHAAIVSNATAQQTFLDNALKPLLQHIAASPNSKQVLGYDLVNEPEANMAGYWGGVNLAPSQVQAFVQKCATYVHTYGGGAYATVGSATSFYLGTWKNLGLDFYQFHYYPWMDFGQGAGTGLPTYASLGLDKPCIVGEYPTNDVSYTMGSTTPLSAQWYLDAIFAKGYAGGFAWSLCVTDSATNWSSFQPLFTNWANAHASVIGPK